MKKGLLLLFVILVQFSFGQTRKIIEDDFKDNRNNWHVENPSKIENGTYHFSFSGEKYLALFSTIPVNYDLTNMNFKVTAEIIIPEDVNNKTQLGFVYSSKDFDNTNIFFVNPFEYDFNVLSIQNSERVEKINTIYVGKLLNSQKLIIEIIKANNFYYYLLNKTLVGRTKFYTPFGKNFGFLLPIKQA